MNWSDFKDRYGTHTTTNFDLMDIGKQLKIPNFRVVMHNELLRLPKNTKNIIMNLDVSSNAGTHWIAIYNTPKYKLYFSSFGDPPSDRVIAFMNKTTSPKTIREYNDWRVQDFGSEYCGQMSVYLLMCLNQGRSANDIIVALLDEE